MLACVESVAILGNRYLTMVEGVCLNSSSDEAVGVETDNMSRHRFSVSSHPAIGGNHESFLGDVGSTR